jgi:hypothetical protein
MSTWTTLESGVIYRDLREQLYDLVWSGPMLRLAKQSGNFRCGDREALP